MNTNRTNISKGKRYTEAEKTKIINHVKHVNKTRGRGGIASASKQFKVSALTISSWLRVNDPLLLSTRTTNRSSDPVVILRRLAELHDEIAKRESELQSLQKGFDKLRKAL